MADGPIVSREMMRDKGAAAFKRGDKRDEHGMNPFALGIREWRQGYDRAATENQSTQSAAGRIENAQVAV